MLSIGYTTRYGGLDATMGLAFAHTGFLFPFFSPVLGWLGVALTGSDTASNSLFGNLQQITANQLHISPVLAAASNSSGGVMGKMIDAQSIVVACVATGQQGRSFGNRRCRHWPHARSPLWPGNIVAFDLFVQRRAVDSECSGRRSDIAFRVLQGTSDELLFHLSEGHCDGRAPGGL